MVNAQGVSAVFLRRAALSIGFAFVLFMYVRAGNLKMARLPF